MLPPTVPTVRILRSIPATLRNPVAVFERYGADYGDNFMLSLGKWRRTHFTVDADVIEHVMRKNHRNYEKSEIQTEQLATYLGKGLLTNTGAGWLEQRRLIQPGFSRQRMTGLVTEMRAVIAEQLEGLDRSRAAGEAVDLYEFCREAVFRVIVRAIFTDGFDEAETEFLSDTLDEVQDYIIYGIRIPFLRTPLRWLGREAKYVAKAGAVRAKIQERIDARRAGSPKDDLLQMLLDSRYEGTDEPMSDEQLIDEIMVLFAAGHETSANSLSWTIWLLLTHPEELDRVRAEITAARAEGPIDGAGVRRLPYLTQVIEESMRLYPPAWITDRVALGPDRVGELDIEQGTVMGLFLYGLHRHPRYWDAPEEFRPARMTAAAKKARHPFCYLPFGGGPRLCIGNHFAMLEMQLFLAELLDRFDLRLAEPARPVGVRPVVTLQMDRAVLVYP